MIVEFGWSLSIVTDETHCCTAAADHRWRLKSLVSIYTSMRVTRAYHDNLKQRRWFSIILDAWNTRCVQIDASVIG